MPRLLQRARPLDAVAAAYGVAFFAWLAFRTPGTSLTEAIAVWAFYPLGPLAAWACWRNSRLPFLAMRTRIGWLLLALSALLLAIAGNGWAWYLHFVGHEWPSWMDNLEVVHSLVAIGAFMVFPARRLEGRGRIQFVLETGLMVVAGFALTIYFDLRLWFAHLTGDSITDALLGPGIDWVYLVVAATGVVQKRERATRVALAWLFLACVSYVAANYVYTLDQARYRPGDAVDGLWFLAWVFTWTGARVAHAGYCRNANADPESIEAAPGYDRSYFSYAVVGLTFVVLAFQALSGDPLLLGLLSLSVAMMVALLLGRQLTELRENDRLFAAQLAQEARFRSFVQHSSDVILVVGPEGRLTYVSPSAPQVLGEGTPVRVGAALTDLVRQDDRPALAPLLAGRTSPGRAVLHLAGGAEAWREIEAVWTDLRDTPTVGGIVVNCRDVSERNEIERQLRHSQKLDAVGRLAGGLAHDINNSLAVIGGYADLLEAELVPSSAAAEDMAHVRQAVERAATITRRVLAFSRRQTIAKTALDVNLVVRELVPMLRQSVRSAVEVRLDLEPHLWPVRGDKGQLEQMLVNLATNARDAMPGGGTFDIRTRNRTLDHASAPTGLAPGDYAEVVVKDSGVGMGPDVVERAFEPFFSTKNATGGMGLGLAMVHDIVRDCGGRVLLDSCLGQGTTFTILFPRCAVPTAAAERPREGVAQPGTLSTVLLVDDEESVRTVARRILQRYGYHVIEAAGGQEALTIIEDRSVNLDVLLTDLVMPKVHGRQLIARCAEVRPQLPIVCMTGYAGEGEDPSQYGPNLVALLSKPFSATALGRAVGAALVRREATS